MTGSYPEVGEITYNAAEQGFQAHVTLKLGSDRFVYGVCVPGGLNMPTSVAELLLAAEAAACHREQRGLRSYHAIDGAGGYNTAKPNAGDQQNPRFWQRPKAA